MSWVRPAVSVMAAEQPSAEMPSLPGVGSLAERPSTRCICDRPLMDCVRVRVAHGPWPDASLYLRSGVRLEQCSNLTAWHHHRQYMPVLIASICDSIKRARHVWTFSLFSTCR